MTQNVMTPYQQCIHFTRYARWRDDLKRRETWAETVQRYIDNVIGEDTEGLYNSIYNMEVMPSMRALATAGPALDRDNTAAFNCVYLPIETTTDFDEAMYCLLCGCGVGFSVEHVDRLPDVPTLYPTDTVINVRDSKIGWCKGLKELIGLLYSGSIPTWDLSKIRPAGARLKTFGGRASGPEPLNELFEFVVTKFTAAQNRKLKDIEVHDIMCMIGRIVQCGGVRRSAEISLSNLSSHSMKTAKYGQWWLDNPQRSMSNNSAVFNEKPSLVEFMDFWASLYESKSGERGIFNRQAAKKIAAAGRRDPNFEFGCNPCSEIILRPRQMCNLSEVIVRPDDTLDTLKEKVRLATILGTYQSRLTNFRYLSKKWQKNCEEERLLGVSLSGCLDNNLLRPELEMLPNKDFLDKNELGPILRELSNVAVETNIEWSKKLGINPSTAITTIKPSGTVSQLVGCSPGIHPSYSAYYIRTIRGDKMDPASAYLISAGVPHETDLTNPNVWVFSFPSKAPEGAVLRDELTALDQLNIWLEYQRHWCEHKPSITVYVRENEWLPVGSWVYEHFDEVSGISFLPYSDHTYKQAPYQPITKEEYEAMPQVELNFTKVLEYEDNTTVAQEIACSGGSCEL